MANFKVVISDPASKKAYQKEAEQAQSGFVGKKVGDKVSGSGIGLEGYEVEITGGSDKDGFPIRPDVEGPARKKIILTSPPGYHPKHSGNRKRKSVRGNTISQDISQVNVKVVKSGSKKLEDIMGKKAEGKKEGKAEEDREDKQDKPAESKPKPKAEEKPKEELKAEEKPAEAKPDEKPKTEDKPNPEEKMGVKTLDKQEKEPQKGDNK